MKMHVICDVLRIERAKPDLLLSVFAFPHSSTPAGSEEFFTKSPRGNTCWCLLSGDCTECDIDDYGNCMSDICDSHWVPTNSTWG